jgi:hypothetical protein
MSSGELVFQDGRPMLVISWRTLDGKRLPYIWFPLDPEKLKSAGRPGVYVYEGDLAPNGNTMKAMTEDYE